MTFNMRQNFVCLLEIGGIVHWSQKFFIYIFMGKSRKYERYFIYNKNH